MWETTDDDRIVLEDQLPWDRDYQPRFGRSVGSTKPQAPKPQSPKPQAAKVQPANVQAAKVQGTKAQAAKVHGDRRTEFPPRMPRRAAR
jgi:hypothetical protein